MSPFLLTHFKVLVSYVYPVEHTSGLIPKLETNSNIFLLSTCWNAFKAMPESASKRRRYHLATNFARK